MSANIAVSNDVVARQVGGETMLLDLASGTYFGLDPVGTRFWQLLEEGKSLAEAHAVMAGEYHVDPAQLEHDLTALLGDLSANGLIEAD